ncbi:hypothetical protein F2P56_027310 [Juglans regia]|uniref:Uncharacterized protein n=2 Tax=Juglans regia TaxID=51240 RepID=A0A833U3I5_JUGRE|nr:uncharacterized protein LOC108994801 isoform X2 [Juglans regia]KAF5452299.1 hypothetical protein F2P56_027310 [Juglans regia]
MSASGGVSIARSRGENRFYNPPHVRQRQQQQQQQQQLQGQEKHQRSTSVSRAGSSSVESEKRTASDECASLSSTKSDCSISGSGLGASDSATNLDRFLEHTTPVVPAQYFPKRSIRGWRNPLPESHPYFVLGDLWESFKEWSAYGAGVPLLLNGSDSVIQYYVPYLSGIQLYIDPTKPSPRLRRPGEESDMSSRESSSDSNSDYGAERGASSVVHGPWSQQNITEANIRGLKRLSVRNKSSSSDESENGNPSGQLVFQYLEHDPPFGREPLADKISVLASRFPELRTYKSSDLSPSSWISVSWYPIYRIPTGPTLQNLDACFLTFHSLSTPFKGSDGLNFCGPRPKEIRSADLSVKLSLPIFGLAYYKFKASDWSPEGVYESQKANSLLRAADNWVRLLKVNHPDYSFFLSHNSNWR